MFKIPIFPILALVAATATAGLANPTTGDRQTALMAPKCASVVNFADIFCTATGMAGTLT